MAYILTFSCVNAFSVGAILAYIEVYKPKLEMLFKKSIRVMFLPLIMLYVFQYTFLQFNYFPSRLVVSLITLNCILICLANNNRNVLFIVFNSKILNFIGMISYGIYLYHCPLPAYWRRVFRTFNLENPFVALDVNYYELATQFAVLILISYLSWIIIEKPILALKKYF